MNFIDLELGPTNGDVADGLEGLKDQPRNGRPPEVSEEKLLKIRKELPRNHLDGRQKR
jgi:transposase